MGKTKKKAAAAPASEPAVLKAPTKVSASADASKAQREVSAKAKKVKVPAAPAVQPDSADKKRKKAEADEIDAIFSDRKKKKAQDAAAAAKEAAELPDGSAKKVRAPGSTCKQPAVEPDPVVAAPASCGSTGRRGPACTALRRRSLTGRLVPCSLLMPCRGRSPRR